MYRVYWADGKSVLARMNPHCVMDLKALFISPGLTVGLSLPINDIQTEVWEKNMYPLYFSTINASILTLLCLCEEVYTSHLKDRVQHFA